MSHEELIKREVSEHLAKCLENETCRRLISFMLIDADGDMTVFAKEFTATTMKMWGENKVLNAGD